MNVEDIGFAKFVGRVHDVDIYVAAPPRLGKPCTEVTILELRHACEAGLRRLRSVALTPEQYMELQCDLAKRGDQVRPPGDGAPGRPEDGALVIRRLLDTCHQILDDAGLVRGGALDERLTRLVAKVRKGATR